MERAAMLDLRHTLCARALCVWLPVVFGLALMAMPVQAQSMIGGKARQADDSDLPKVAPVQGTATTLPDAAMPAPESAAQPLTTDGAVTCLLTPARVSNIASPYGGMVAEVAIKRADLVEKDQLLVQLDDRIAKSDLHLATIAMQALAEKLTRGEKLEATRMISRDEIENMRADYDTARAQVARAQLQVDMTRITAPFAGVVSEANVEKGEVLSSAPILQVIDIETLQVELVFARGSFGRLQVGQTLTIGVDLVSRTVPATITAVDPFLDASSNTFSVLAKVENADRSLPAGASCTVQP